MTLRGEKQRGFTLLELLVVIAILGMLIGLTVPALSSARRQGKRTACLANLHALSQAVTAYAADDPRGTLIPVHPIAPDALLEHIRKALRISLLEGTNNRIKVIKRMAYGLRDDAYFFLKIRASFPGNA